MIELRIKAALLMKLCHSENEARVVKTNVPDVIVIAPPEDDQNGVTARYVSCDRPHRAAPVTSSMALAAAVFIEGTVASEIGTFEERGNLLIHHPSGTLSVQAEINPAGGVLCTSVIRTMRTIMRGELLLPMAVKHL